MKALLEVHDEIAAHIQNSLEEVKYIDGVSSNEDSDEDEEEKQEVERTPAHGTLVRDAAADWHQLLLSKCLVTRHESWKHANICSRCGKKYASKRSMH